MEEMSLPSPIPYILLFPSATRLLSALLLQNQFGRNGDKCPRDFCLFVSDTKNLLFNDNTECLANLQGKDTYEEYLGSSYVTAVANLRQCSSTRKCNAQGSQHAGRVARLLGWASSRNEDGSKKIKAICYPTASGSYSVTDEMKDLEKNQAVVILNLVIC